MNFNIIVSYYERIAATRKRLEITEILTQMIQQCTQSRQLSDLPQIIYLTQGQLVAEIADFPKFGIAEKMIIQAMVKYTAIDATQIKALINKFGDVGEAIQSLMEKQQRKQNFSSMDSFLKISPSATKDLEISVLYRELEKLASEKGAGSQDRKIDIIIGLIRQCTPQAAKYVVNIIISNLRIGIADMTIIDALSLAFTKDKTNRQIIEDAYNIHPDLGYISGILVRDGLIGVQNIQIQVGTPIRMMLASRIQYTQIQQKLGGNDFIAEYKYDGERVQVHKNGNTILLFSRHQKEISTQYPDVVIALREGIHANQVIFEGEIVAMDPFFEKMRPFQVLSTRRRKYEVDKMVKEVPVTLFCFDLLYLNTYSTPNVMQLPLLERRRLLESLFTPSDQLQCSTLRMLHSTAEMVAFFNEAREKGAEGIMNKKIGTDAIYKAGNRGFLWIKLKGLEGSKLADTIDVVIIGGSWGKGRRKGVLSPLYGAVWNENSGQFEFLTRIGSGFSDEDLDNFTTIFKDLQMESKPKDVTCSDLPEVWLRPQIVMEIMGDELTISSKSDAGVTPDTPNGYGVRFPVFQRVREDKGIYQITTTAEIIDMYNNQL